MLADDWVPTFCLVAEQDMVIVSSLHYASVNSCNKCSIDEVLQYCK